jgi:hypothetical protein
VRTIPILSTYQWQQPGTQHLLLSCLHTDLTCFVLLRTTSSPLRCSWASIPEWEAWSLSAECRRSHLPGGLYQWVPGKGEGFPEDFVPFVVSVQAATAVLSTPLMLYVWRCGSAPTVLAACTCQHCACAALMCPACTCCVWSCSPQRCVHHSGAFCQCSIELFDSAMSFWCWHAV